jgi:ATP-dependent DNA ligase
MRAPQLDGDDLRALPLGEAARQAPARHRVERAHSDDGATIFQQACKLGLEGIVSKRLSAPYRSGPSRDWLKVKNLDSPAMIRAREVEW